MEGRGGGGRNCEGVGGEGVGTAFAAQTLFGNSATERSLFDLSLSFSSILRVLTYIKYMQGKCVKYRGGDE